MLWTLLALSCVHKVRVESEPPGAVVFYKRERVGVTPVEFQTWWAPHVRNGLPRHTVRVNLQGHRAVVIDLGEDMRWWRYWRRPFFSWRDCIRPTVEWDEGACIRPRSTHEVVLVPDHGPAGTWTPEDIR